MPTTADDIEATRKFREVYGNGCDHRRQPTCTEVSCAYCGFAAVTRIDGKPVCVNCFEEMTK